MINTSKMVKLFLYMNKLLNDCQINFEQVKWKLRMIVLKDVTEY